MFKENTMAPPKPKDAANSALYAKLFSLSKDIQSSLWYEYGVRVSWSKTVEAFWCELNSHVSEKVTKPSLPIPGPEVGDPKPLLASFINLKVKNNILIIIIIKKNL